MKPITYANIAREVLAVAPGFRMAFDEHVRDNSGVLQHVLFGDLTRYFIAQYRAARGGEQASAEEVAKLTSLLERTLTQSRDESLQTLIVTSFLENLWQAAEDYEGIRIALGPALRAALDKLDNLEVR